MRSNMENIYVKKTIMLNFIWITLALVLLESLIDSTMQWADKSSNLIAEYFSINQTSFMYFAIALYLLLSILVFILAAYIFYIRTNKILEAESQKRVDEQNILFASIAHDLKTPMTSIQGFSRALMDAKIKSEDTRDTYKLIYEKTQYMNDLLDTMFDYAKYGTSDYKLIKEEFDLNVMVRNLVANHYQDFENKNVNLEVDIPNSPVDILADKRELKRALENLIINSYIHNPKGTKVKISVYKNKGKSYISIADDGPLIDKNIDIFKIFATANKNRVQDQGKGMGLVISKRIIEKHGGKIEYRESSGEYKKEFLVEL